MHLTGLRQRTGINAEGTEDTEFAETEAEGKGERGTPSDTMKRVRNVLISKRLRRVRRAGMSVRI